MLRYRLFFAIFSGLALWQPLAANEKADAAGKEASELPKPKKVRTEAAVTIAGEVVDYSVTAARLQLETDAGKPRASVFYVAYERKGAGDPESRPVVFAFNGGPGSSSVWLHLGGIGPRLVPSAPDGTEALPPPHRTVENPFSILDVADLVFIDPVSTGYSRAPEDKAKDFHGVEEDVASVGDFIRRWVTENERWGSPKFLLGESYGGIRAAGLAQHLQTRYGMDLNGVILLSSLLDFRTLDSSSGNDLAYSVFLPAYAAVAHYHGKIEGEREALLEEVRSFAFDEYAAVLAQGRALSAERKLEVAERLAGYTSLPVEWILDTNLRIDPWRFRVELLRQEGKVLGRFDGRVAWPSTSRTKAYPDYDPSYALVSGAFSTAMLDYLTELGWKENRPYEILTRAVHPWKWGEENGYVNLADELAVAMRDNPHLRVCVMAGRTDLATPAGGMTHSLNHLYGLPEERVAGIEFFQYEAGHMFYLNQPDLEKMRADLVRFIGGR